MKLAETRGPTRAYGARLGGHASRPRLRRIAIFSKDGALHQSTVELELQNQLTQCRSLEGKDILSHPTRPLSPHSVAPNLINMSSFKGLYLFCWMYLATIVAAVGPDAIYDGGYNVQNASLLLRIGNGGAGQSGLIEGSLPLDKM